jgi:hypothetical protein
MNGSLSMAGRELADAEINEIWEAWTPGEVVQRMSRVAAPWYVAAGWALELFTGNAAREHDDLEIAVPAIRFGEIMAAGLAVPRAVDKPLSDMAT